MKKEIWKDIPGYEGFYQVSDMGKIKGISRTVRRKSVAKNQGEFFTIKEKYKNILRDTYGYEIVGFCKNSKLKTIKVHRIIATAFIPNPENKPQVNHINGFRNDNRIENLEWCTSKENIIHSFKHLNKNETRFKIEKLNPLPILQFELNGALIKEYPTRAQAEKETGVNQSDICKCASLKQKTAGGFLWKNKITNLCTA